MHVYLSIYLFRSRDDAAKRKHSKFKLVIPCLKQNNWRIPGHSGDDSAALKEEAIRELIRTEEENGADDGVVHEEIEIPMVVRNRVPQGFEQEGSLDVSLRPDEV